MRDPPPPTRSETVGPKTLITSRRRAGERRTRLIATLRKSPASPLPAGLGPTVVGTLVGQAIVNTTLSVAFLGLASGSILYVVVELLGVNRAFGLRVLASSGILVGVFIGFGTDLVLKALGG